MKFFLKGAVLPCGLFFVLFCAGVLFAQSAPQNTTPKPAAGAADGSTTDSQTQSKGTVIFSRSAASDESTDKPAKTAQSADQKTADQKIQAQSGEALKAELVAQAQANPVREAERVRALALDLHLQTAMQGLAARAEVQVQNAGSAPLKEIRLEISSTLHWESARLKSAGGEKSIAFTQTRLYSDADHTGAMSEIVMPLAEPLAPGAAVEFDLRYAGAVPLAADRLTAIGTPDDLARKSDWDRIATDFTGLRGFGNVAWFPLAATPVFLGEGARLFDVLAEHRKQQAGTKFSLQLTVEYPPGEAPTVAVVNGREVALSRTDAHSDSEVAGVARAKFDEAELGFDEPSLFVAQRSLHEIGKLRLWTANPDEVAVTDTIQPWTIAAEDVEPFLIDWLGERPTARLTILELPEAKDALFESGALLVTPLATDAGPAQLDGLETALVHSLTHTWIQAESPAPRPLWLSEGLANFIASLWLEKQHGRDAALRLLEGGRGALAIAEPESPGSSDGDPLVAAVQPAYTRTKSTYVFWMLRDMIGDGPLATALRTPLKGSDAAAVNASFEEQLKQAAGAKDLGWFFKDWIDTDKGLPDLSITSFFPSKASTPGSWLVSVDIANTGYVAAQVKVTVRSGTNQESERVLVPARGKVTPRLLILGKPLEVQVNDGTVAETEATVHVKTMEQ
jgi:hypothetical protein